MPSYSPVYSQAFILYTDSTPNLSFDVPEGFTAVVRQITAYTSLGGLQVVAYVLPEGGPATAVFAANNLVGVNAAWAWEGRVVQEGPGTVGINVSSEALDSSVYVGGYLLRNTLS